MEINELRKRIWESIPFDIHSKKLSYSRMKDLLISVKEYINNIVNPRETTEAQKVGLVFECLLLEPGNFDKKFFIKPETPKFLNQTEQKKLKIENPVSVEDQKSAFEEMISDKAAGRVIITGIQYSQSMSMVNGINTHPLAKRLLSQNIEVQKKFTLQAAFEITGALDVLCQAKEDIYCAGNILLPKGHLYILDLKKINNIEEKTISNQIRDYKYYIQSYVYRMAIQRMIQLGEIQKPDDQIEIPFFFIFQEDSAPYDTHIVELDCADDKIEAGFDKMAQKEISKAFAIFKALREEPEKVFFGINAGITTIKAKRYMLDDVNERDQRLVFYSEESKLEKFMFEKDLDLSFVKPSFSVDLQNIFNHIETKKQLDKNNVLENNVVENGGVEKNILPCNAAVDLSDSSENKTRKRRTKAEIEAARIAELNNVAIFTAVATLTPESKENESVAKPEEFASLSVIDIRQDEKAPDFNLEKMPEKTDTPGPTVEELIDLGSNLKHFASGLFAVKKTAQLLGFCDDLSKVKLFELTPEQRILIEANLTNCLKSQKGVTDDIEY